MSAKRYTAVFTGFFTGKKPGEYFYLSMSEDPFSPGGSVLRRGRPPYEQMGREIPFGDFPEDYQQLILDIYRELWDLENEERLPQRHKRILEEEGKACGLPVTPT